MGRCRECPTIEPAFSCARYGGEGACTLEANRPRSLEGRAFVEAMPMLNQQIRVGFGGMVGFDMSACIEVLELQGIPPAVSAVLLPFWEQGFHDHLVERKEEDNTR